MDKINKRVVLALYRNKLKLSHSMGYNYGKWNDNNIIDESKSISKTLKKLRNERIFKQINGDFIMDNVRYRYKISKNITDDDLINLSIDNGFNILKKINNILHK